MVLVPFGAQLSNSSKLMRRSRLTLIRGGEDLAQIAQANNTTIFRHARVIVEKGCAAITVVACICEVLVEMLCRKRG